MLANRSDFREDAGMDFAAAGLLDGLDGEERRGRINLLERLTAAGFQLEELRAAVTENRLALLPLDQVLAGRYTAQELEARTGTPTAVTLRIRRLLGLPRANAEDRVFSEDDLAATRSTKLFLDTGLSESALSDVTRVLGEAMARLAATVAAAFADSFLEPGDSEDAVAMRFETLTEQLMPALGPVLSAAFAAHLRESVSRGMIGRTELRSGRVAGSQDVAVCFADLVGFTRLGGELEAQELGGVAGRLAELAGDVSTDGVRLVKTIGDAAMLVGSEPAPTVKAALALLDAAREAELPSLRAGIAFGPALQRAGDFFGHTVNLASRITGAARPDSVLCTQEVRDAAQDDYAWSFAGRFRLKGVSHQVALYRARAPAET